VALVACNLQTQKQQLEKAETSYNKSAARLKELQSSYQEGSASKLIETLTEHVNNLRFQVRVRVLIDAGVGKKQEESCCLQPTLFALGNIPTCPMARTRLFLPLTDGANPVISSCSMYESFLGNSCPQVNERYPKELEKRQRRAAALSEAFTNGVNTESDLQRLQAQVCAPVLLK
jgi:hypothetical protein